MTAPPFDWMIFLILGVFLLSQAPAAHTRVIRQVFALAAFNVPQCFLFRQLVAHSVSCTTAIS
jgi:hypothetical protein